MSSLRSRSSVVRELSTLIMLHDGPWRWKVGLYAAFGMGLPLALFTLSGHQAEGLVASMGAFTALYFAAAHISDRARLQPLIALMFSASAFLGTMTSDSVALSTLFLIALASAVTVATLGYGFGPPGPMMFVLVGGVTNQIARTGSPSDAGLGDFTVPVLVTVGAFSAYLVATSPILIPAVRRRSTPAIPLRQMLRFDRWDLVNRIIAYRVIAAVTIASLTALPLGFDHAYWVVMVAGVVLQVNHSLRRTVIRVVHRVLGTFAGIGSFLLISQLELTGMKLVLVLATLQGLIEVVVTKHYGIALIFMTPLALTIATSSRDVPMTEIAVERILDTLLGSGIALVVLIVSEWLINRSKDDRGVI